MVKEKFIPLGPYHPLLEEPEFFKLYVEEETIIDAELRIGYNHRGIEKMGESKTFDQVPFLVERICGICSTSHPLAFVLAVEDLAQIQVPERAQYIRTIMAEMERIHSHLLWVGLAGHFLGYNTVFMWAWKAREPLLDTCELMTGNRNHYAMMKIGGVRRDFQPQKLETLKEVLSEIEKFTTMITHAVIDDPVFHARTKGVGVLTKQDAIEMGVVGPVARASGLAIDVRKNQPYAAYDRITWNVITQESGCVFAKAAVRLLEIIESIKIIRQCIKNIPKGEIEIEVREIPAGEGIGLAEAPRGEVFHYVRSNGSNYPERLKIRAPSYMNIASFKRTVIGEKIADAALITAAVDPCYCCTERMGVINKQTNQVMLDGSELVRLSQLKTEEVRKKLKCT
ncbi:MAG: nickel-dependent hydrogenase large subunit [Candidatus Saganbacteria bacterium]|nr:nickel-dependent hydrogenase large subunit [Candidatus Saganbacteria bacterium]